MAVPASGPLSLRGIRREVSYSNYTQPVSILNISLSDVSTGVNGTLNTSSSSRPDGSAPHKMSEWYGYDHDASIATAPTVSTGLCGWDSTNNDIDAVGSVSSDGGSTITERGFVYSTTNPPTTSSGKTTVSGTTGTMSANLPAIQFSSSYNMYVRAYAINSIGTSYGATRTVTVPASTGKGGGGFDFDP